MSVLLHDACLRHDSAFCDGVLPLFDDTTLARQHPGRVTDAYFCQVIAHKRYPARDQERFRQLAAYDTTGSLSACYRYFIGRRHQAQGDDEAAIEVFQNVLPDFEAIGDSVGIATVSKRLGLIYWRLRQPEVAIPYLRRAVAYDNTAEDRCIELYYLGLCFTRLAALDSVRGCIVRLEAEGRDTVLRRRGDQRGPQLVKALRFNADALHAMEARDIAPDELRAAFDTAEAAIGLGLDDYTAVLNDTAAILERRTLFARALAGLGDRAEALVLVRQAEVLLAHCTTCQVFGPDLLLVEADLHQQRGDMTAAMNAMRRYARSLSDNRVDEARVRVERAKARGEFERQQAAVRELLEKEKEARTAQVAENRTQRFRLLLLMGLLTLIGALLINRSRLKRRIQVEQLRTRLSRDLHDDIGSTLSSINILTSVARKKAEAGDASGAATSLAGISERSQRLQRNMSDIVWSVDPDKDAMDDLIARMREFGASVLEPKDITFSLEAGADLPASLSPELKSNIYLIFKEAVNNAAKHAQATRVDVRVRKEEGALRMTVADNGKGIAPDKSDANGGGNGLRNMRERASQINARLAIEASAALGTTVDLRLHG